MSPRASNRVVFFAIVAVATVFYFWHLGRPDIITDESSIAVRAIGMVDFDFGIEQPTPWQWVEKVPWWMHLSFHDHPPLVFLAQHVSMRLFGENPFAIRLPSVLAGLAAVWLVYLIGRRLYGPIAGLSAASLFAFTVNHVWISRIGLQESIAIALMLASAYTFLKGLERPRWLPAAGVLLGLAFLAKYYALILVPIFLSVLLIHRATLPHRFKSYFLFSIFSFLIAASPVIIYNIQLYRHFGHFDFQFSQLFGQNVPAWQARPGQEVLGSYANRVTTYIPRLIESNSPYFLILSVAGLIAIFWEFVRRRALVIRHSSFAIFLVWLLPFLVFIGPAHRFLSLLTPWLAIAAGFGITAIGNYSQILKNLRIVALLVVLLAVAEASYAYNSVIAVEPIGSRPWAYSYLRRQTGSWGFNELNAYLNEELIAKTPDPVITFEFPFAKRLAGETATEGALRGLEPAPLGIVYNDNINLSSQLWVFLRRIIYQGWPVASAESFRGGGAAEFFKASGVKRVILVNPTAAALQDRTRPPTPDGDIMEAELNAKGLRPKEIENPRGEVTFRVYQFEIQ